jgi:hypothetical protein
MDPLTLIVSALAAGAAAGLKPTAEAAVKDAYAAVKKLIEDRYKKVSVALIEAEPSAQARQEVLHDDLKRAGAHEDLDLLAKSVQLAQVVHAHAEAAAKEIGVDIEEVAAQGSVIIENVTSNSGSAVAAKKVTAGGDFRISNIRAGEAGEKNGRP